MLFLSFLSFFMSHDSYQQALAWFFFLLSFSFFLINRRCARSCIVLLPLLGITWMFGLLSLAGLGIAFDYVFTVFNSIQVTVVTDSAQWILGTNLLEHITLSIIHLTLLSCLLFSEKRIVPRRRWDANSFSQFVFATGSSHFCLPRPERSWGKQKNQQRLLSAWKLFWDKWKSTFIPHKNRTIGSWTIW